MHPSPARINLNSKPYFTRDGKRVLLRTGGFLRHEPSYTF
jgi:hypothetical protein